MKQTKNRKRRGTALVESALTLSLYSMIVFSLFDFGYIMFLHQTLANRAATAARYGALNPTDTTGMKNWAVYNASTGSGTALFGLTTSNVAATRAGSGTMADRVTITISGYKYPAVWPGMSGNGKPISVTVPVEAN